MIRHFFCPVCRNVLATAHNDGILGKYPVYRHLETHGRWGQARGRFLLWWWHWRTRLFGRFALRRQRRAG